MFDQSQKIYSVSELNSEVKNTLERKYSNIKLRGEVSQLQTVRSGHTYFTLKDESAAIDCVLFRYYGTMVKKRLKTTLDTLVGQSIQLTGQLSLYTARGRYQFIARDIEIQDKGTLHLQFEELKKKLGQKGYFDQEHKKNIPKYPKRVAVVSSPTGAAIQDIIRTFERRNPSIAIVLYPAAVQGAEAAGQIANAIDLANQRKSEDVLIVARGGGSLEDLWAFNEEPVADAIFRSEIPVLTGIGHQTDFSIADLVADDRQATPSTAAERVCTPSRDEILVDLNQYAELLQNLAISKLNTMTQRVDLAEKGLIHPQQRIENYRNLFMHFQRRIDDLLNNQIQIRKNKVASARQSLLAHSPQKQIRNYHENLSNQQIILKLHMEELLSRNKARIDSLKNELEAVNPTATLNRGYSIIRRVKDRSIIRQSQNVAIGEKVTAQLADGSLLLDVEAVDPEIPKRLS